MKIITSFFIVMSLSFYSIGQQAKTVEIPRTTSGKLLSEWLSVFAKGDQNEYVRFISAHYTNTLLEDSDAAINLADRQARRYLDAVAYQVQKIEKSSDSETVVLAKAFLTGFWYRILLKSEVAHPFKIKEYSLSRIHSPFVEKKLSQEQLTEEVKKFMKKLESKDAFSGTILLAKKNKIIFQSAYGLANKGYNVPNKIDTKFSIASIGKVFTATAIFQLIEKGKIALTDTLGKFLTDYPNKQVSGSVTIHHLLTHTSGLGDIHGREYICRKGILREVKDYYPLFASDSLQFEPGSKCQYSNVGYILLGAVIEKASGENYFEYVRKHIFNPVGMSNTDFYETDIDVPDRATGYTNFKDLGDDYFQFHLGQRRNTSLYNGARGNPQGGVVSTVSDLFKFTLAFKTFKLVNESSVRLMTTNQTFFRKEDVSDVYYGYGFELINHNNSKEIWHGGGDLGISTAVSMFPAPDEYTVIVLSNYDRGGIIAIYKIQEFLRR